jgi:hypothetical protein
MSKNFKNDPSERRKLFLKSGHTRYGKKNYAGFEYEDVTK